LFVDDFLAGLHDRATLLRAAGFSGPTARIAATAAACGATIAGTGRADGDGQQDRRK
jgi:hypothetical protein